ncbi:MAG TPA: GFA family protein [Candidatus Binataceae bacterium]|nr:GFA family protein [Candidatus Binataceae bacterium]
MSGTLSGGCACGAIRYESSAAPIFTGTCHCRDCQRASGGASSSVLALPEAALRLTGEVKYHTVKADSGKTLSRGFCGNCGSPVTNRGEAMPGLVMIAAGSLDDPKSFKPAIDIWTSSALPWDNMNPALPKFPKNPPQS